MQKIGTYRQVLRQIRPVLLLVAILSAVVNILMLTSPMFMLQVYDRVLTSGSVATLQGLLVVVVLLYVFMGLFDALRGKLLSRAAHRLDAELAGPAFQASMRTDVEPRGQALRDLEVLRSFMSGPALAVFDLPWIPFYVLLVFAIHPWLGVLTLAGAGIVAVASILNQLLTSGKMTRAMRMEADERDFQSKTRQGSETIVALGMQKAVTGRWKEMHDTRLGMAQAGAEGSQGFSTFIKTFRMFLQSALLAMAAYLTIRQEISSGMIIASSIIAGRALAPVDQIIGQWPAVLRARLSHKAMFSHFPDALNLGQGLRLPAPKGKIEVENLTRLAPGRAGDTTRQALLAQVSFALEAGDGLGVIGASGSGKSTLARLLVGAIKPDAGEIRYDGALPEQWSDGDLGRGIGYLPQRLDLLPGTIRDNICRFDPNAQDIDILRTARLAGVHEMILSLPEGYSTKIGADALPLSGGQLQRLGLARALYGNPKILILDEPNSNLDQEGDAMLAQIMAELRAKGTTVIVMAHRAGAIASLNKILYLKEGRVVAFGPKEEILAPVASIERRAVAKA